MKAIVFSWILLILATLNTTCIAGKTRAFSAFVAEFRKRYVNASLTELNWVEDTGLAISLIGSGLFTFSILQFGKQFKAFQLIGAGIIFVGFITSALIPNIHWLFLTYSVISGIGSSIVIAVCGLIVDEYFDATHPHRVFATTIVTGSGISSMGFVSIFAAIIQTCGWRWAFVIYGFMFFVMNVSLAIVYQRYNEICTSESKSGQTCSVELLSKKNWILIVLWFLKRSITAAVSQGLLVNLTDYMYRTHNSLVYSTILANLYNFGLLTVYILSIIFAFVSRDLLKGKLKYLFLVTSLGLSCCLYALEYASSFLLQEILCFMAGFMLGPTNVFFYSAGEEMTQLPGHISFPLGMGSYGFGVLLSPFCTSLIAESFHYRWFFFAQGTFIGFKALLIILIIILLKIYPNDTDQSNYIKLEHHEKDDDISVEEEN